MSAAIKVLITILEVLFFVGVAGSLLVVAWTTVEDFSLFSKSDEKPDEYLTTDITRSPQSEVPPMLGSDTAAS